MALPVLSVSDQLKQLDDARKLVLSDANYYPQIIQGILPIIGPSARVELRRWGADFLAETFANPLVPPNARETMSLIILENLKSMIENPNEDAAVVKSAVQTAASIYPFVFKWIINNPYDKPTWERMTAIKSRILRIWDTAPPGIRICCIKFAQRVVFVQTAAPEKERRDPMDISVSMVPENHELIPPQKLGAEASGLLDRMLGVFHESATDAVLIDATLNSLSILIRARPIIANKILNAILNFNPLKLANSPMTPKLRVMAKSMEKTTTVLLIHILKRDPHGPLAPKITAYVERMMRSRAEIFNDATRKRGPPEPTDGLDPAKRQKLGAVAPPVAPAPKLIIPPFAPGPHTTAELFTITDDKGLQGFDVSQLPEHLVLKIVVTILSKVDGDLLKQACTGVLDRYKTMMAPPPAAALQAAQGALLINPTAPLGVEVEEDEDEYEPDFEAAEDTEQILNKLDNAPPEPSPDRAPEVSITTFKMPPPEPLSEKEIIENGQNTVLRIVNDFKAMPQSVVKKSSAGINRLAGSMGDKDAWVTIMTRLATRSTAGLENQDPVIKSEPGAAKPILKLSDTIREQLYEYVMENFRTRIDVAISWLCEEWYNETVLSKSGLAVPSSSNYDKWAMKLLDGMMTYLDAKDKILTRFLGEIPKLSKEMLGRVKLLCRDPVLVQLALTSLLYLAMMRPPVREMALDAVEEVWVSYPDARPMAGKYLAKYRPGFVEKQSGGEQESKQE